MKCLTFLCSAIVCLNSSLQAQTMIPATEQTTLPPAEAELIRTIYIDPGLASGESPPADPGTVTAVCPYEVTDADWNQDSSLLALAVSKGTGNPVCTNEGFIQIFDMTDPQTPVLWYTLSDPTDGVNTITFSHSGKRLAAGQYTNGELRFYDTAGKVPKLIYPVIRDATETLHTLAFNHDDTQLAAGGDDSIVRQYDVSTEPVALIDPSLNEATDQVFSLDYSQNRGFLAVGGDDDDVRVYDVSGSESKLLLPVLEHSEGEITSLTFAHHKNWLIAVSPDDDQVRFYTIARQQSPQLLEPAFRIANPTAMGLSHDDKRLAIRTSSISGMPDNIFIFDASSYPPQFIQMIPDQEVSTVINRLAFSHNDSLLVSTRNDKGASVYRMTRNNGSVRSIYRTPVISSFLALSITLSLMSFF